jgi:GT2 family glycosyltransferase
VRSKTFLRLFVGGHYVVVVAESLLIHLLSNINQKVNSGQLDLAIREIGYAWRTFPSETVTLAPVFARLLVKEGKNLVGATDLYLRALENDPTPGLEAELIQVLNLSGQYEAARSRLEAALRKYAVSAQSSLALCARQIVNSPTSLFSGWVGMEPSMQLRAEAFTHSTISRFEVLSENDDCLNSCESIVVDGRAIAKFSIPASSLHGQIKIRSDSGPLLGGSRTTAMTFAVDGRAAEKGGLVSGWARLGWNPSSPLVLKISDKYGRSKKFRATQQVSLSRWGFQFNHRRSSLTGGIFTISVLTPDGNWQRLPDDPLISESRAKAGLPKVPAHTPKLKTLEDSPTTQLLVDVIIPAYRDRERTLACIESVYETRRSVGKFIQSIIVVDDASPDPLLSDSLDKLADSGVITLLRNSVNLGFSGSVNRAVALSKDNDIVLVNSDVVVFDNWLERLCSAAYRYPRIGTVTPFADDDSIAGYSSTGEDSEQVSVAKELDQLVAVANRRMTVDIPVGVGFCLFIRRACWDEVGPLDATIFDAGYGEESDFCMRARALNWRHLLAADVFVHHAGSRSFGIRRAALLERSRRLLNLRHPGYDQFVSHFLSIDPLLPYKRQMDIERLRSADREIVLVISLALIMNGGVERFVAERCRRIRADGRTPAVLRPFKLGPESCVLNCEDLQLKHLFFRMDADMSKLIGLLGSLRIAAIEVHHFLGLPPRLLKAVLRLKFPYDIYLHDYAWICPRITLIDGSSSYCGEPRLSACERCIALNGSELFETISVGALRRRSQRWLIDARRVIAPSNDTAARFQRYMPHLGIEVEPHETFVIAASRPRLVNQVVRVALLGAIGRHKGYKILLDCARDAKRRKLNLEFVVVGYSEDDAKLIKTGRVFVTGQYDDDQLTTLLNQQNPTIVFLPSVWPETWSYTLSHAIRSGLPIVAFDIGAIAERLRAEETGTLLPLGLPCQAINDRLLSLSN